MRRSLTINDKMYNFDIQSNGCYIGYLNGVMIVSGYASSYDNAVSAVESYIDNLLGKTTKVEEVKTEVKTATVVEETKVGEPVVEETVAEETVEEVAGEEPVIRVTADKNEDGTFTVTLRYGTEGYDVEGAVIKYTTNGKDVVSSSKIYKEAISVAEGTVINANAYVNKEVVASLKAYEVK